MTALRSGLDDSIELFDEAIETIPVPPPNSDAYTIRELRLLQSICHGASNADRAMAMRYRGNGWRPELNRILMGDLPESVTAAVKKADIVVTLFKIHYGRPRPRQLGEAVGVPIYAMDDCDSTSSYVSHGVTIARLIAVLMSRAKPDLSADLYRLCDDVVKSRKIGGWHYPSDCMGAIALADFLAVRLGTSV